MGIVAGKFVVGQTVVATTATKQLPAIEEHDKQPEIQQLHQYGKIKVGNFVNLNKFVKAVSAPPPVSDADKRLSAYFVIPKDSDYLDHNRKT